MHDAPRERQHAPPEPPDPASDRRTVLSNLTMAGGLVAGYGALAAIAGRFLYPARPAERAWQFVARVEDLAPGSSMSYRTPSGARINVARRGRTGGAEDFVALSSTCPHLGCSVHWQPQHNRFFCPCHNGVFDPDGVAIAGPPAEAGQRLSSYPLKVESGLLYIEVPTGRLARGGEVVDDAPQGPGHDPCLARRMPRHA